MTDPRRQLQAQVRFEWGERGAEAITPGAALAVVVDVLSFTTTLTVAIDTGGEVYPFPWKGESAQAFASEHGATLAVGRFEADTADGPIPAVTLSPTSMAAAADVGRVVLPSPNGSALAWMLARRSVTVIGAALRNRMAVARWIVGLDRQQAVAVIAAGERWPDDSLRPAVEDLWGAGAVIAALEDLGISELSPEARTAAASFRAVAADLPAQIAACSSGRELTLKGLGPDNEIAAELDTSNCIPIISGERFVNAG
jgi:2-phosphosulfolactate phosphatase